MQVLKNIFVHSLRKWEMIIPLYFTSLIVFVCVFVFLMCWCPSHVGFSVLSVRIMLYPVHACVLSLSFILLRSMIFILNPNFTSLIF